VNEYRKVWVHAALTVALEGGGWSH